MKQDRKLYKPKQKRGEATKNKILDTAMRLFCQDGYYNVSTNEIAQDANLSIGNLYFYFPNKEEIFLQILNRYYMSYVKIHEAFLKEMDALDGDLTNFLHRLLMAILKLHEDSLELNREIRVLSLSNARVKIIVQKQQEELKKIVIHYFKIYKYKIKVKDIEAAAEITFILFDSLIDQIAFSENLIERDRLISETLNVIKQYLLK
ncbi:TetR/AcrR family transcriptional regulator [Caproicibacter sp.]|uniref:TetR/AcrR family transcriptional regulator n=1 Tax=Caproicibacter sp. TaxID=2814884 RepID=UPI003988D871